jgi:hypothetical protein
MKERFAVYVNGKPVEIYLGMKVKHALIGFDYALYEDCLEGRAMVRDENGFVVGLDGALSEGARLEVKRV